MEKSLPLHLLHADSFTIIINRSHAILHFIAILFLLHYRLFLFFFLDPETSSTAVVPKMPWLLLFTFKLLLTLSWLLSRAFRWCSVNRTIFPERLSPDNELPAIDVFICTEDPDKEPTVEVMSTVISAVVLDYPSKKLHVYVSDDIGSDATLSCTKEAWKFAMLWVPFCRRDGVVTACPGVYFLSFDDDHGKFKSSEF